MTPVSWTATENHWQSSGIKISGAEIPGTIGCYCVGAWEHSNDSFVCRISRDISWSVLMKDMARFLTGVHDRRLLYIAWYTVPRSSSQSVASTVLLEVFVTLGAYPSASRDALLSVHSSTIVKKVSCVPSVATQYNLYCVYITHVQYTRLDNTICGQSPLHPLNLRLKIPTSSRALPWMHMEIIIIIWIITTTILYIKFVIRNSKIWRRLGTTFFEQ